MLREEAVKKNLDLHLEWMKYVSENPDVLDSIQKGATLVILPEDDEELYEENIKIVEKSRKENIPVVIVRMKTPKTTISKIEVSATW
jgi:ABC-type uncharacterized transport system substrate-binding protein